MIFFVKGNKLKDSYIEEPQYKHGNKTVRLDDSVFLTVLRDIALIKTTLVIMGSIICKAIVSVSHISFCLLVTAHYIP